MRMFRIFACKRPMFLLYCCRSNSACIVYCTMSAFLYTHYMRTRTLYHSLLLASLALSDIYSLHQTTSTKSKWARIQSISKEIGQFDLYNLQIAVYFAIATYISDPIIFFAYLTFWDAVFFVLLLFNLSFCAKCNDAICIYQSK